MKFDNMVLYVKPGCPFCHRVLDFMTANDIQIDTVNSTDPQHRQELLDMNGTTQSPCLVIDGQAYARVRRHHRVSEGSHRLTAPS